MTARTLNPCGHLDTRECAFCPRCGTAVESSTPVTVTDGWLVLGTHDAEADSLADSALIADLIGVS